ncbi:ATP-binding protein [Novosphingobium sp.]|uniref:two-component system sensor histidine kinase NtrB n=1 Tax=Novosphingobium sp. TaxID=1874826 RepID=UPI0026345631|nr:ATP-binding protein [Novosphingobium sp.]
MPVPSASADGTKAQLSAQSLVGAVIDASLDAVVIADDAGMILRVNPAAGAIFGHALEDMIGQSIGAMIVPPHMRAAHERGMARHAATGEGRVVGKRLELDAWHAEGRTFPVEIQIEQIALGEQQVYAAFIRDLTERKAMEAEMARQRAQLHQQEKLTALGALLGGVAHELNNPLAVVIGRAAILEDALAGTPDERDIVKLRDAANRCHRIVRTFLAMAREPRPMQGQVNLNELLAGTLEFSGYGLRNADIAVEVDYDPAVVAIPGDHDRLVQAFVGLITNAQQALADHPGPRRLRVATALHDTQVQVTIADNGPGIDDAIKDRVFEPFFTTRAFGEGGGHGLAIARGVVESHGGAIAFESKRGQGCAVLVRLPIDPAPAGDAAR